MEEEEEENVEREKEKIQEERGECFRHIRRYRYNIESGSTPSPLLHHIWSSIFYFILFYFFFFSLWLAYRLGSLSLSLGTPYTFFFFFFHPNNNKKKMKCLRDVIAELSASNSLFVLSVSERVLLWLSYNIVILLCFSSHRWTHSRIHV